MGLADRDYMRERNESRGAVYSTRRPRSELRRQILKGLAAGGCLAVALVARDRIAHHDRPQPIVQSPPTATAQPALTPPAAPPPQLIAIPVGTDPPVQPFPASGTTQWYRPTSPDQQTGILRIMDTSDMRGNKVVRIRDAFGTPVAQTYIQDQEGAQLVLPLGSYQLTFAIGSDWHGPEAQFGADARYLRAGEGVEVVAGEANYRLLPAGQDGRTMASIDGAGF